VLIEQRLDFSKYVESGFGTGDCVIIADGTLHIIDFKYGQGLLVDAVDNPQMKLYALGALEIFDGMCSLRGPAYTSSCIFKFLHKVQRTFTQLV